MAQQTQVTKIPAPCLFADLDKGCRDIINESYPENNKGEITTKLHSTGTVTTELNSSLVHQSNGNSLKGTVAPKFTHLPSGVVVKTTLDTSSLVKVDASITDKIAKGVKLNAVAECGSASKGKVTVEYRHERAALASTLSSNGTSGPMSLDSSVSIAAAPKIVLGSSISVANLGVDNELKSVKGGLFYRDGATVSGLVLNSTSAGSNARGLSAQASVSHRLCPNTNIALTVTHDLKGDSSPFMAAGVVHKMKDDFTVRAKVNSSGAVGASITTKLNANTDFTVSGQGNLTTGLSSAKENKVGFHLSFRK